MRTSLLLTVMLAWLAPAVTVDGIAITVGTKVIAASEIRLRLRLTAFENGVEPGFDLPSRRKAAEQLIDQKLVEREMDIGHYPRSDAQSRTQLLPEYAKAFFRSHAAALSRALLLRGLTATDLEEDLARQADLLKFLSLRFRPAMQAGDKEMETWLADQRKRTRIEYLDKDLAP